MTTKTARAEWLWGAFCFVVMLLWVPWIARLESSLPMPAVVGQPAAAQPTNENQKTIDRTCTEQTNLVLQPLASAKCLFEGMSEEQQREKTEISTTKVPPETLPDQATEISPDSESPLTSDEAPQAPQAESDAGVDKWILYTSLAWFGLAIGAFFRWRAKPSWWVAGIGTILVAILCLVIQESVAIWAIERGYTVSFDESEKQIAGIVHGWAVAILFALSMILAAMTLPEKLRNVPGIWKVILTVLLLLPVLSLAARGSIVGSDDNNPLAMAYPYIVWGAMTALGGISRWRSWPTMLFLGLCLLEGVRSHYNMGPSWSAFIVQGSQIDLLDFTKIFSVMLATKFLGLVIGQNFSIAQRLSLVEENPLWSEHFGAFRNSWPMFLLFGMAVYVSGVVGQIATRMGVEATREAYELSASKLVVDARGGNAVDASGCAEVSQTLELSEQNDTTVDKALLAATVQMEALLLKCAETRINRAAQSFGQGNQNSAAFIRYLGANMLPREHAPNADLGCKWYQIGCRLKEWVLRRLRDAYLKASDAIRTEANKEAAAFESSNAENINAARLRLLDIYNEKIRAGQNAAATGIRAGTQRYEQFNMISWLYACMVLLQAYLFVWARRVFRIEKGLSAELEGRVLRQDQEGTISYVEPDNAPVAKQSGTDQSISHIPACWVNRKQEYILDEAVVNLGWSLRTDLIIEGEHDRLTIPQKAFAMILRVLTRRYRMRRVDKLSWKRAQAFGFNAVTIRTTTPVSLVEFSLPQGSAIFFRDLKPLAGFTDGIALETVYSLRITSLLFGQAIFRKATAKSAGRMLFVVTGEPPGARVGPGGAPATNYFVFPTGTLVAWDQYEHFKVSAEDSIEDTFFSEHSLRADCRRVLRDQTAGRGFSTAVFRIIRRFLFPL